MNCLGVPIIIIIIIFIIILFYIYIYIYMYNIYIYMCIYKLIDNLYLETPKHADKKLNRKIPKHDAMIQIKGGEIFLIL